MKILSKIDKLKDFLLSLIFPNRCLMCDEIIDMDSYVCDECMEKFSSQSIVRYIPYFKNDESVECISPFLYENHVRKAIWNFKFYGQKALGKFFAKAIYDKLVSTYSLDDMDFIAYVPMTEKSLNKRGYNQSKCLAEELSKLMNVPVSDAIVKCRETFVQHELDAESRAKNILNAFCLSDKSDVKNKNFILCDDIITTGSTLRECAKTLKSGGAKNIICCTVASSYY